MQVAQTILQQLGGNKFVAMTGARDLSSTGRALQFRLGRNAKNVRWARISLTPADLYEVTFYNSAARAVATIEDVYADQLARVFTEQTGLATSL